MKDTSRFLVILLLCAAVWDCSFHPKTGAKPEMQYRLECAGTFQSGEPVVILFTLESLADETLWVLKWLTPLEGIKGGIFKAACGGQEVPYEGPLVSRIGPFKSDYVRIEPRGSVSAQVDLSRVYRLPAGEECTVSFTGRILDVNAGEVPTPGASGNTIAIPGNPAVFRIVPPKTQ
jgi:peptidyl-Lys metalloendopeptidase